NEDAQRRLRIHRVLAASRQSADHQYRQPRPDVSDQVAAQGRQRQLRQRSGLVHVAAVYGRDLRRFRSRPELAARYGGDWWHGSPLRCDGQSVHLQLADAEQLECLLRLDADFEGRYHALGGLPDEEVASKEAWPHALEWIREPDG